MSRLEYLYEKCMAAEAGAGEQREFVELLRLEQNAPVAKELIARAYHTPKEVVDIDEERSKAILEAILNSAETSNTPVHRIHFLKTAWFKYAAAILLIVTGIGIYYNFFHTPRSRTEVVSDTPPSVPGLEILPGSNRAVLTLSNGSKVELNNVASETITDGTLSIENNQGQLSYKNLEVAVTNTMSTPKGGQYKLTLADGTQVWLNAASSITYPTAFTGNTREVSVTGEAYFEVTKNKEKPFIVTVATPYPPLAEVAAKRPEVDRERSERTRTFPRTGGRSREARTAGYTITVLGTSFNVNAYSNENHKTSVITGSVKVNSTVLKPNQAYVNGKVTPTNTNQDIAWKNGRFDFEDLTLEQAMNQLSRWYDVSIKYDGNIRNVKFKGSMERALTLSEVIEGLEGIGGLHYELQQRTLVVTATK